MKRRGMLVHVYRSMSGDCTAGGATATAKLALLVGGSVPEVFEESPDMPTLELVVRWGGSKNEYRHAQPLRESWPEGKLGPVDGGNFIYSSDSRYREHVCAYPIPVHDRFDTPRDYNLLTR